MDPVEKDGVPANVQQLIDAIGFADIGGKDEEEEAIFKLPEEGKCMCCHGDLGSNTVLSITRVGIVLAFCGGQCMTDMAVIGWLQEQHDDITSAVKFRSGLFDEVSTDADAEADVDEG